MNKKSYPKWALWIAKDEDGKCWAYQAEPLQFHKGWYENEIGQYEQVICPIGLQALPWQNAIIAIKKFSMP